MLSRSSNQGPRAAFSLLELTIALALITIASVIAIPAFYSQPGVTLDNAAVLLARDMRYAQNAAVLIGEETWLVVDENGDGYSVMRADGELLQNPIGGGELVRTYSADAIFEGIDIPHVDSDVDRTFRFNRHGFCLQRGQVELRYGDRVRILCVKQGSGRITIDGLLTPWSDDGT